MPTPSRVCWTGTFAVCAAILPLLAACSHEPLSPSGVHPSLTIAPPTWLRANSVKYSDIGSHPATGRAGSASLASRALLGKDGSTLVEATTGAFDDGSTPPGVIAGIQAKEIHLQGVSTTNFGGLDAGGYWTRSYTTLAHGDQLQLQAIIRGIDPNRTDVVTLRDTVKLRPDLEASHLLAPARASVNTAVQISARVSEINLDVGAHADCVLLVDGQQVSTAQGIWVDAGDAVSCAFVTTFSTVGTKQVTIAAVNVRPGDWDMANNSVSGTIELVSPEVRLAWSSSFNGVDQTFDQQYSDPWKGYHHVGYLKSRAIITNASVHDTTTAGKTMTMTATLTSGSATVATASAAMQRISWSGSDCRSGFDAQTNTTFTFCHYPSGQTSLGAASRSTRVVYYGQDYYGSNGYSVAVNVDSTAGFGGFAVGTPVSFDVRATDERGTIWHAPGTTTVAASPFRNSCSYNTGMYSCSGYTQGTNYSGSTFGH